MVVTADDADPVVSLDGVDAGYADRLVLRDVSLTVAAGTRVGLIGPNGSGKSTLFRVALGTLRPWRGTVELFDRPVQELDRRRYPVAYVPQARTLALAFPLSARDVVSQGRVGRLGLFRFPGRADREAVARALEQVGMAPHADRPFAALSGGQQQRVLLARALASGARLFFMDEPVTGVDVATGAQFDRVLDRLVAEGHTLVIITHDLSAEHLAHFDWLVCVNGGIVAQGPPAEVTTLEVFRRLFTHRPVGAGVGGVG